MQEVCQEDVIAAKADVDVVPQAAAADLAPANDMEADAEVALADEEE